ncbi:hypothetical protein CVT24_001532 [Panaeolus cyanescens]|uniref:Uncharacterized protein n=1 Tax=Panaeolus cyanescens TaxID=181874 RepID=A0A409YYS2_9AGAR|nr:hypothetical protein CVT24_001532 [Panaeolus cyanescens]
MLFFSAVTFVMRVYAVTGKNVFLVGLLSLLGLLSTVLDVVQVVELSCTQQANPIVITGIQLGGIILYFLPQGLYSTVLNQFTILISSVLISRFLLDMRSIAMSDSRGPSSRLSHSTHLPAIEFAPVDLTKSARSAEDGSRSSGTSWGRASRSNINGSGSTFVQDFDFEGLEYLRSLELVSKASEEEMAWLDYDYDGLAAREIFDDFWARDDVTDVQNQPPPPQSDPSGAAAAPHHKHPGHGVSGGKIKRAYDVLDDFYARADLISELSTRELVDELESRLLRRDDAATADAPGASGGAQDVPSSSPAPAADVPAPGPATDGTAQGGQNGQEPHHAHHKKKHHHGHHKKHHHGHHKKHHPQAQEAQTGQTGQA